MVQGRDTFEQTLQLIHLQKYITHPSPPSLTARLSDSISNNLRRRAMAYIEFFKPLSDKEKFSSSRDNSYIYDVQPFCGMSYL